MQHLTMYRPVVFVGEDKITTETLIVKQLRIMAKSPKRDSAPTVNRTVTWIWKCAVLPDVYRITLTFRHRASSVLGQAFRCSPENAFYIFNQQIYFII